MPPWIHAAWAVAIVASACGMKPDPLAEEKRAALNSIGQKVVFPTLQQFEAEAWALSSAMETYATARKAGAADAERTAARAAFKTALMTWERAELFGFGPAGQAGRFTSGASLRDGIYAWPAVNACQIDTLLVSREYALPGYLEGALVTVRGLGAIERLLFLDSSDNGCPPDATINASGSWAALPAQDLALRRAEYASAAAELVARGADALHSAWEEGFAAQLAQAGSSGSGFPDAQAALNEVFSALFYVDTNVKDAKLATPAGIDPSCTQPTCPQLAEAIHSGLSKDALRENLQAALALYRGSWDAGGSGFDRLLELREAPELATQLDALLTDSLRAVNELPGPVDVAVTTDLPAVTTAHAAVRTFTDLMKSQMVTTLALKPPDQGAGDND